MLTSARDRRCLVHRIVEIEADIVMQRALVALQRQDIVSALTNDLLCDRALAVERVSGHDRALQRQHLQKLRHGGDLVRLRVGGDLRQHKALLTAPRTDHVQRRSAAGALKERRRTLPSIATTPSTVAAKRAMNR